MVCQRRAAPVVRSSQDTTRNLYRYSEASATNLAGKNPSAFTLAAIDKSSSRIAGYVFCCASDNNKRQATLAICPLKVDTEYQR